VKTFLVGGSVRDELLGLPVQDRDHVVVGASPEEMVRAGFRPVGADFPVFLHPQTHEEYALARTERKTAPGYKGFTFHAAPEVTLEEDLRRRDLTINAMARGEDGELIDPYGGERDLQARILRHVSEAFAEDPVRILRVARFAARFARFGFAVAPETAALMRRMVEAGEVDALVPERVWQEVARGLMEHDPSRMLAVLRDCGALARVLPELDAAFERPDVPEKLAARLDQSAQNQFGLPVRYATMLLDLDLEAIAALGARLNAPSDCRELALIAARERDLLRQDTLDAQTTLDLIERCDALRRPWRIHRLLEATSFDGLGDDAIARRNTWIKQSVAAARSVDAGAVAREHPEDIPGAIRRARLVAIASLESAPG